MTTANGIAPVLDMRPSSLDRLSRCQASAAESAGLPSLGSEEAAAGTALDVAIGRGLATSDTRPVEASQYSAEFGVDLDASAFPRAVSFGVAWVKANMPDSVRWQVPLVTGTADGVAIETGDAFDVTKAWLTDCKATAIGGDAPDDRLQMLAYVAEIGEKWDPPEIRSSILYPYQGRASEWVVYDRAAIQKAREIVAAVRARAEEQAALPQSRRSYRTGDHCKFCRAFASCPAIAQEGARIGTMLAAIEKPGFVLERSRLPTTWALVKQFEKIADGPFKDAVKMALEQGEIEDVSGTLRMSSRANNPKVKYEDAVAWLTSENKELAERMDRELTSALPPAGKSWFPKLFATRKEKR